MQTTGIDSSESETGNYVSNFYVQTAIGPDPDDEEENDGEEDKKGEESDGGDPPLDEEVVHSPVTTQDGGKPK